jgi:uncharacterized UPF0160 family protein
MESEASAGKTIKRVGTHSGTFHCDEVTATALLQHHVPSMKNSKLVRSRDDADLQQCGCVVDVGGVYDSSAARFDHHQPSFSHTYNSNFSTKLSSAGLVWKHFGSLILRDMLGWDNECSEHVNTVKDMVYRTFIHEIDAIDNGVQRFDCDSPPRYEANTHLSARIARLNPKWNDSNRSPERQMELFMQSQKIALAEAHDHVHEAAHVALPARNVVDSALASRFTHEEHGRLLVLSNGGVPWKELLFELESSPGSVKYVLYEDVGGSSWRVQAVPQMLGTFTSRLPMPHSWRGLRGEELSEATGVDGCVFCHTAGFIGGNNTFEGAKQMAKEALKQMEQ